MLLSDFSEKEFLTAKQQILIQLTQMKKPEQNPIAYLLGGQPGAGKTTLQHLIELKHTNVVVIDGDTFRKYHPNFLKLQEEYGVDSAQYTAKFSGAMTESTLQTLCANKYSVVVEGTLRTTQVPIKTAKLFLAAGYAVELDVMAVNALLSYISIFFRYETMLANHSQPRMTSKEAHDTVVITLPANMETLYATGLFTSICLYTRNTVKIYDSTQMGESPAGILAEVLTAAKTPGILITASKQLQMIQHFLNNRNLVPQEVKMYNEFNSWLLSQHLPTLDLTQTPAIETNYFK